MCEGLYALAHIPNESISVDPVINSPQGDKGVIADPRAAKENGKTYKEKKNGKDDLFVHRIQASYPHLGKIACQAPKMGIVQ